VIGDDNLYTVKGLPLFCYDSCVENLVCFYLIKLVNLESVIMYSQRVASFSLCVGSLCSFSLVSTVNW